MSERSMLLVEDDPDDVELTMRTLHRGGSDHRVDVVRDGVEAMDYLMCRGKYSQRDAYDLPTVILLDLKMPRIGGLEVLEELRANELTRDIPVVVVTTSRERGDLEKSYRLGANSYIHKPVNFEEFMDLLKRIAEYWLEMNEPVPEQ